MLHLQFLSEQKAEYTATLIRLRVLPLYTIPLPLPYLVASANWVLGELASCLPEVRFFVIRAHLSNRVFINYFLGTSLFPFSFFS